MPNRWRIAAAGVVMQIALGAIYAWSVFRIPLTSAYGWSISEVTLTFTIAIFVLGFAAFAGGVWMRRVGPRRVALCAGLLYGVGVFLASFSGGRLWWLYGSYGLMGGIGLGLGYIVPVATLVKWFPDRRGMITGLAVAGFGAGALITAPIATRLIVEVGPLRDIRNPGSPVSDCRHSSGVFHAEPAGRIQPARVDADDCEDVANGAFPHARGCAAHLAMVRALDVALPEHDRRHCDYFAGRADGRRSHRRDRRSGGRNGRHHCDRERGRTTVLGVAL